jgi:hypothetical protein
MANGYNRFRKDRALKEDKIRILLNNYLLMARLSLSNVRIRAMVTAMSNETAYSAIRLIHASAPEYEKLLKIISKARI